MSTSDSGLTPPYISTTLLAGILSIGSQSSHQRSCSDNVTVRQRCTYPPESVLGVGIGEQLDLTGSPAGSRSDKWKVRQTLMVLPSSQAASPQSQLHQPSHQLSYSPITFLPNLLRNPLYSTLDHDTRYVCVHINQPPHGLP